jgi:hypothetical protein
MHRRKLRSMTAAILVLAGISLLLGSCNDLPDTTSTTAASSGTTTAGGPATTTMAGGPVTTTTPGVTTTAAPATTAPPATTATTAGPTATTAGPTATTAGPTATTRPPEDVHIGYIQSIHHLLNEMDLDEQRIPQLVIEINSTKPAVPGSTRDDLQNMVDMVGMYLATDSMVTVPAGYEDAQYWLLEAGNHMVNWINALIDAIDAMDASGSAVSGTAALEQAGIEADAYWSAKQNHYDAIPLH